MKKFFAPALWFALILLGSWAYAVLAFRRGIVGEIAGRLKINL